MDRAVILASFFLIQILMTQITLLGNWTGASTQPATIQLLKNGDFIHVAVSLATEDPPLLDSVLIFDTKLPLEYRPSLDRQIPGVLVLVNGAFINGILYVQTDGTLAIGVCAGEHGPSSFGTTGECGVFSSQVATYHL